MTKFEFYVAVVCVFIIAICIIRIGLCMATMV